MNAMRLLKIAAAAAAIGWLISMGGAAVYADPGDSSHQTGTSVPASSSAANPSSQETASEAGESSRAPHESSRAPVPPSSDHSPSSDASSHVPPSSMESSGDVSSAAASSGSHSGASSLLPPSSTGTSSVSSAHPTAPDSFRVETNGTNISRYFQKDTKNVQFIRGQVPASVEKITVTLTAHGVTTTETLTLDNTGAKQGKNGFQFEFPITFVGKDKKTTYTYYISVVREYDLSGLISVPDYASRAPSSAAPSSRTESVTISSEKPSSTVSEAIGDLSSALDATSSDASSTSGEETKKGGNWLIPLAILCIVLGAGGVGFVVWQILKLRGILPPKHDEPADAAEPTDGFVDILGMGEESRPAPKHSETPDPSAEASADPDDGKIDLDAFFNSKS